jgi:NAD(P)-dependent dehydrogenase (short-subunit alcohol dehydrogenase family)
MKTWFITGASRGFGALIMEAALASDSVVATARDPSSIADHPRVLKLPLDVTNEGQARDAAARAIEKFGRIDVVVNNAGYGLLGGVEEASATEVQRVFATNVFGLLNVTRAVLPHMRSRRSGHIINMSSIGGFASSPGWGVYCATKFAVEGVSEALSIELAPLGIHATVVEAVGRRCPPRGCRPRNSRLGGSASAGACCG